MSKELTTHIRNQEILQLVTHNVPYIKIARIYNISDTRVGQIVNAEKTATYAYAGHLIMRRKIPPASQLRCIDCGQWGAVYDFVRFEPVCRKDRNKKIVERQEAISGESHHLHKLTKEIIEEARFLRNKFGKKLTYQKLAARYGVHYDTMRRAILGKENWKHI